MDDVEVACGVLAGNTSVEISPTKIVSHFLRGDTRNPERIKAKNELLCHLVQKYQTMELGIYVKDKCPVCSGLGFDPGIFTLIDIKCPSCLGTGWKVTDCLRCKGTGKIGEVPCYTCKGKGVYIYRKTVEHTGKKCLRCGGAGTTKMLAQKLEEIKTCVVCEGTGVYNNPNPVIEMEVGLELIKYIKS